MYGGLWYWYGAMLWDLYGEKASKVYHAWSTCVKLTWGVPRSTHTYLVEDVLAKDASRVQYLKKLINARQEKKSQALETNEIDELIDSLCSS